MQHYLFSQIDSWFFRESRSMDGSGASALESVFPPNNQTLLGALRTQIGERYFRRNGGNWRDFSNDSELAGIIGYSQDYARLKAQGAWLYSNKHDALYFPAPNNLVQRGNGETYAFFSLPDSPSSTDLGRIRLPQLTSRGNDLRDAPLEQHWISCEDYSRVLRGEAPQALLKQDDILRKDPRLGINRNNQTRRTEDGMLYQTQHCRLHTDWSIYLGLDGIKDDYCPTDTILRLGGEARMAALAPLSKAPSLPKAPDAPTPTLMLYLLTPLADNRNNKHTPPLPGTEFTCKNNGSYDFWRGELSGVTINIISAIVGKSQRIGGWDMANHHSLPVRSYLPAGSCWYIECDNREHAGHIIRTLHLSYLSAGSDRALGYGQVAVGLAPEFK